MTTTSRMKNSFVFLAAIGAACTAGAANFHIDTFDADQLHIQGAVCEFHNKANGTVLAGDGVGKFWIKVDGKLIALAGHQTDAEASRAMETRHWREVFTSPDVTVAIDLVQNAWGEDVIGHKGTLEVRRKGVSKQIPVEGDCSA